MRVHHLDCGPMRPLGGSLVDGRPGLLRTARMCCHVLLVESPDGLVLVDSGLGRGDLANPPGTMPRPFWWLVNPRRDPAAAAVEQVAALGFDPRDVRHVLLTHLDLDHAGGLVDFPWATVHVHGPELRAATNPATAGEKQRYVAAQWAHQPKWAVHEDTPGERWFGLDAVKALPGLSEDFLLVPLPGHTRGHVGVAVKGDDGWLLHAGDAYFHRAQLDQKPSTTPVLRVFEGAVQTLAKERKANQQRLRDLVRQHGSEVAVFSAHDDTELSRFTS
ncbi:MBL fold metallo-hydrolase [Actinokineospora bangkokensis]|uniref:MBL fold metallo-hydrolase n=1 Tax=Actinokineospora bangkokensis TaxID=1193682 RepID=A0A1Q9LD01_9PSEU|nr:MBL fold metallo-hydrolase [Actinokineospora bangkokensis]OLR89889.1 MBL fold metallo-hydrolase [Actinokineospora bangkokensis]